MPLLLLLLPHAGTILGLALFLPLPSILGQPGGPHFPKGSRPLASESPPVLGPKIASQPLIQCPARDLPPELSLALIIRRPYFHCDHIAGNSNCSTRDLHIEVYYDLPAFAAYTKLRDSIQLVKRYSLEPFMTPRQFFYPRVVIEFYHTMTSRQGPNPTAIHFSIDGRPGILRATDIAVAFNLSMVLANSTDYR